MAGPAEGHHLPITFLSDYGLEDEFVGVVHRVVAGVAPSVRVVDLAHQLPPHDVGAAALMLWRCVPWLVPGVVLAVVDPGVGTPRRGVVISVGPAGAHFVGPDNGLLLPAARAAGPVTGVVALSPPAVAAAAGTAEVGSAARGATFDGRDLFAPAAALLATGCDPDALGEVVSAESLVGDDARQPGAASSTVADGELRARVLWVDRFGNAQLDARPSDLAALGLDTALAVRVQVLPASGRAGPLHPPRAAAEVAGGPRVARRAVGYAELGPDELGLVTDSYGMLALSLDRQSAARMLGVAAGDEVAIRPAPARD